MTLGGLLLAFLPALVAGPEALPRIVLSLQKSVPGKVVVNVENVSPQPLVLAARTYLVLLGTPSETPQAPRYWGEVKVVGLPSSLAPMALTGRQRVQLSLDPSSLLWASDRSSISTGRPLAHAVPAGEYELQVQIVDERGAWWRSGGVPIKVSRGGGVTFSTQGVADFRDGIRQKEESRFSGPSDEPIDGFGWLGAVAAEAARTVEKGAIDLARGKTDELKGRVKEAAGALTGDEKLKEEGQLDQAVGKIKQTADKAIDRVKNAVK